MTLEAGATPAEADAIAADYGEAQLEALRKAMLAVALLALLSIGFTRRLPGSPLDTTPRRSHLVRLSAAGTGTPRPDGRDRRRRPREDLRQGRPGSRRDPVLRPGRRGVRSPRAERGRQVHDRPDPRDADDAPTPGAQPSPVTTSRPEPGAVRRAIGYVPQASGVDREATGRENLVLQGRLQGMRGADLERRSADLLETFGLTDKANALVKTLLRAA